MAEQGDGSHVGPNDEPPILLEIDQMGDMEHIIMIIAVHPFVLHGQEIIAFFQRQVLDEDNNNENDENVFIIGLIDVVNLDNVDNVDNNREVLQVDYDNDGINDNGGNNNFLQVAGEGAEVEVEVDQHVEVAEEDPLPGGSRRRSREEDSENEGSHNSKRSRLSDDFPASDSDEDSLPGGSNEKESAEDDEDERREF